jgi:hypothetical protein
MIESPGPFSARYPATCPCGAPPKEDNPSQLGFLVAQPAPTSSILTDIDAGKVLVQPYTPRALLCEG